ncbi:glycosyltransferase family 4 protein [Haloarculaceae archaeon H-GB2-1]|nr:glycosyltransferase family 4 protein [Haloarculaceae archaeon H-GB11]MEA5406480.1 glycosyltransferase family 4 protein [Haloarculaceae archaeon H-GB2-1]
MTLTEPARDAFVSAGVAPEKVTVEPDAVDLEAYEPHLSKTAARNRLELDPLGTYVVYTGSLIAGKGVRTLLKACRDLPVEVLLVGGRDDEQAELVQFCDRQGIENVRFAGRVPPTSVAVYQQAADVLALPPRADVTNHRHNPDITSPLKMFEYMAAERPIVATDLPGIRDVLTHEETALLVAPGDAEMLEQAIEHLLSNSELAASLASHARDAVASYTWDRRCERILSVVT